MNLFQQSFQDQFVGTPGILNRRNQADAERRHQTAVFTNHGIRRPEADLMGHQWCIRLVNARRASERAIDSAAFKVRHELYLRYGWKIDARPTLLPTLPERPYASLLS